MLLSVIRHSSKESLLRLLLRLHLDQLKGCRDTLCSFSKIPPIRNTSATFWPLAESVQLMQMCIKFAKIHCFIKALITVLIAVQLQNCIDVLESLCK